MLTDLQKRKIGVIAPIAGVGGIVGGTAGLAANRYKINSSITPEEDIEYDRLANDFNDAYNAYNSTGKMGFITKSGQGDPLADRYIQASQSFLDKDTEIRDKYGSNLIAPAGALIGGGIAGGLAAHKLRSFSYVSYANFYDPAIEAGKGVLLAANGFTLPNALYNIKATRDKQRLTSTLDDLTNKGQELQGQLDSQRSNILKNIGLASGLGGVAGIGIGYGGDRYQRNSEYSFNYMTTFNFDASPLIGAGEAGLGTWIAANRLGNTKKLKQGNKLLQEAIEQAGLDNSTLQAQQGLEKLVGNKFILPAATLSSVYGGKLLGDKLQSRQSEFNKYAKATYGDSKKSRDWTKKKKYNTAYKDKGLKVG